LTFINNVSNFKESIKIKTKICYMNNSTLKKKEFYYLGNNFNPGNYTLSWK